MRRRFSKILKILLPILMIANSILGSLSIRLHNNKDWRSPSGLIDLGVAITGIILIITLWIFWWESVRAEAWFRKTLDAEREESDAWKASAQAALDDLGRVMSKQFQIWLLTPS
ncbi:MAG: hypothetical protein LBG44_04755, partial [Gemmatimonadota bacterium]|nr:hypothetical protein [Gemmatimonadota bacterium]